MTVDSTLKADVARPQGQQVLIQLLEISHPAWSQTFRICNHNKDIIHGGNTYTAWAFSIPLVSENQGQLPQPALVLDSADPTIAQAIKATAGSKLGRIQVVAKLVTYANPDYVQRGPTTFKVRRVQCNIFQIVAQLTLLSVEFDAIPFKKIDPTNFPGSFGAIR